MAGIHVSSTARLEGARFEGASSGGCNKRLCHIYPIQLEIESSLQPSPPAPLPEAVLDLCPLQPCPLERQHAVRTLLCVTSQTRTPPQNAVVDQFRDSGQRPSVDTDTPDLPLVVYIDKGSALLYRSLSGTRSMHKRGYRDAMHAASLKENVAAGLLLASGWDPEAQSLADPMCGSGTLVIEAALIAMRRAPGLVAMGAFGGKNGGRSEAGWRPAVASWPDFDAGLWREVVGDALRAARTSSPVSIMGNDWHHGALSLAWVSLGGCINLRDIFSWV